MDWSFLTDSIQASFFGVGVGATAGYFVGIWRERRRHYQLHHSSRKAP